jgi:hypothetical protein
MRLAHIPRPRAPRGTASSGEEGQALVIFAVALTVLLLVVGLVIDGGQAFYNRRDAQNTADLATLAGTRVIADFHTEGRGGGSTVYRAIDEVVSGNECSSGDDADVHCEWSAYYIKPSGTGEARLSDVQNGGSIPNDAQGVVVRVHREPPTYFLGLIGQQTWDVDAEAAGMTARSTGLPPGQVLPIGVDPPNNNFRPNGLYQLTAGKDAPGNFSWLSWDGSNDAGTLAESLCNPNNPEMTFPVWLAGDPGKSNSSRVRECVDKWIENKTTVLIPLWDEVRGQGNSVEFRIRGLAAFQLVDRGQPAIDSITARFLEYYPLPTISGGYGGPPCEPGSDGCGDQVVFVGLSR